MYECLAVLIVVSIGRGGDPPAGCRSVCLWAQFRVVTISAAWSVVPVVERKGHWSSVVLGGSMADSVSLPLWLPAQAGEMISTTTVVAFLIESWASAFCMAVSTFNAHVVGVTGILMYGWWSGGSRVLQWARRLLWVRLASSCWQIQSQMSCYLMACHSKIRQHFSLPWLFENL